ncbi:thiamine pyrophosphate-binding protein [Quisquiliibacterium transsilvanicum]|uniref:Acetolactate synthase-1/2/3 large subunit n=1 Tax=Quisquiliibacterium transsilvanicum TaxID=1549638 RepID=A0A7W8M8P7_9BURK|nr:thiamine pyrophosphate-binding protein [Quisquiliibacterium transsilvanicum]MBB5271244.1 acetolactate synthase-1/2/3 large subunit [Quisquiliibacterium transsilvanicum]
MAKYWPAELAVRALLDEGVDTMFGLMGGHIQPIQDHAYRAGIRVVQVRHEQAAAHAADGYARVTRKPGVCFGTAGPGMLNMVTGIHMAHVSRTPMVCLFGGHKEAESHRATMQEAYAAEVCRSLTKWTVRVTDPALINHFIRKAFRDAMTPPYGPVGIELPIDCYNADRMDERAVAAYRPGAWRAEPAARAFTDPAIARKVAQALMSAKRPLIFAGEGIHWSWADQALRGLVERTGIPFNVRRLGRGAIPEDHPLAVSAGARKALVDEADLILVVGLQMGYLEGFGEWKTPARFIQVQSCAQDVLPSLPTEFEIVADPRAALEQILDACDGLVPDDGRSAWGSRAGDLQREANSRLAREAESVSGDAPIHPRWLAKVVNDCVTEDTSVVFDSFTSSTFLGEQFRARRSGQVLDAGLNAAFGHGVGMSIGAQIGRPGTPVLAMMGDGGMGLGGGDIETAVRYGLPVVHLVYNDSTFCAGVEDYCYGKDFRVLGPNANKGFLLTPDVRYDLMYATLGCHAEHVESPDQIVPALERAFDSGKTAVINLIGTRNVKHPLYDSPSAREMFWHLPADEVEEPARKRHHEGFYPRFHAGRLLTDD